MAYDLTTSPVDWQNILNNHLASDIDVASKVTQLGVFDFRAFLNLSMLKASLLDAAFKGEL